MGQTARQLKESLTGHRAEELAKFGALTGQFSALREIALGRDRPEKAREVIEEYLRQD